MRFLERIKGVEPSCSAWEADVLPMNYIRGSLCEIYYSRHARKMQSLFFVDCGAGAGWRRLFAAASESMRLVGTALIHAVDELSGGRSRSAGASGFRSETGILPDSSPALPVSCPCGDAEMWRTMCAAAIRETKDGAPHPSSGLRETPDATFSSRRRRSLQVS